MKKLFAILAVFALGTGVLACDFGEEDDATTMEEDTFVPENDTSTPDEDVALVGDCTDGQSAGLFYVRIADDADNATLTTCGNGNPGVDIDGIVLVRPDGTEYYAATVEEDADVVGGVCEKNDKDDINTVLGQPDGCVKELGCGCGDFGYPNNPDCECSDSGNYVGYYSLNGGAIIVSFDEGAEILCGDQIVVYEMWNPDVAGSEEAYQVAYGDENGNWIDQVDFATGVGTVDVIWEW
jgi:hypothetical protein